MTKVNQHLGMVLRGVGVSPGIVLGVAARFDREALPIERVHLPQSLLDSEVRRLYGAVASAEAEIDTLQAELVSTGRSEGEHLGVLSAHKVMLHDQMLLGDAERRIQEQGINAEWALTEALQHIGTIFEAMEDPFFRERGQDVQHVGDLLMRALSGGEGMRSVVQSVGPGSVVVADTLSPAEALALARLPVGAFVLDKGSATGHTAIIAHSMDIPAVVGLTGVGEHVGQGDRIIVDGGEGEVIVHPSEGEELVYGRRARRARAFFKALRQNRNQPAVTPCGEGLITLRGNLDIADEIPRILECGGEGVGLFRTEFLFLDRRDLPSEEEQLETYARVLDELAPHPVTIRTLDIGGDKQLKAERPGIKASPALRAIRYCMRDRDLFKVQLRALMRASVHGSLRLLIPFVTTLSEVQWTRRLMSEVREELLAEGHDVAESIPTGIMIEVPAAALIADILAREVDFFSVGTNDLIQYTLAVERDEQAVDHLYQPLHPAMLRLLQAVTRAARAGKIDVAMCGEMASDPRYAMILLALGFTELSMNAASIPLVKEVIRRTERADALRLLQKTMGMSSVLEITDYVDSYMVEHFPDIVTPRMRGAPRYAR